MDNRATALRVEVFVTAVKSTMKVAALVIFVAAFQIAAFAADTATPPSSVLIFHSSQRPTPAAIVIEDTLRKGLPTADVLRRLRALPIWI